MMRITITTILAAASVTAYALPPVPLPEAEPLPYVDGTPEERSVPFLAWYEDLSPVGYTEQEILMSGEANTWEYVDEEARTTNVQIATTGNPYTTRVLLRHPIDPEDFNGVVYMEVLNATSRYDGAPMWDFTYRSIIASGAAWVGVTYSDTTANFMKNIWGTTNFPAPAGAQPRNNSRYATLNIPTRAYIWDIMSQASALLKADWEADNPLAGFGVDTIIVTGYSQSARYVTTYGNSFYPQYGTVPDDPIVDGYIVAAGGPVSSTLDGRSFHRDGPDDPRNYNISEGHTVRFTSESDIDSALVRLSQDENPKLRTYEAAGTSHVDGADSDVRGQISEYQFGITGSGGFDCDLPLNPIRTGVPLSAMQHRLANWIQYGDLPPDDRLIEYDALNNLWIRDEDGNAIGGVRTARIEVPLGRYVGRTPYSGPNIITGILCGSIIGGFEEFNDEEIIARYRNKQLLLRKTWGALLVQWLDGFVLPVDVKTVIKDTRAIDIEGLPERPRMRNRDRRRGRGPR